MLGILKYDIKATYKKIILFLILVLAIGLLSKFFWSEAFYNLFDSNNFYVATICKFASLGVYGCIAFLTLISVAVNMSSRYGQNMFGNQGYFVNSLPLNGWIKVGSKVLTAFIWNFIVVSCIAISLVIFVVGNEQVLAILAVFDEFADSGAGNLHIGWVSVSGCLFFICNGTLFTLLLYASISLGQLVDDVRNIVIFFGFIALGIATVVLVALLAMVLGVFNIGDVGNMEAIFALLQKTAIKMSIICVLISGVLFWLSAYIVDTKLNLE